MKVLTSRVVVCAIVSILMASAVRAEDKVGTGGVMAKSGDVETPSRSGSTPAIDYKVVTSKAYVDNEISALAAHKVNGVAISNENNQFYAEETARNSGSSATKTVRLSGGGMDSDATTIPTGMILVIKPGETSTVVPTTLKLKRTSSDTTGISKSLRYNGAAITTDMAGKVWNANTPSIWAFDGTNWNFVGGGTVADGLVDDLASHTVNGAPLSNLASTFYGSGTGADGEMKQVRISSIDSTTTDVLPPTGLIIVVQPTAGDTRGRFRLKLNRFLDAPVFYRGEPVNENNVEQVWSKKFPSTFVFDGTNWVFLGTVDTDTKYSTMSVNEGTTGTATDQRVLTAQNLKPIIQGTTLTNIDTTATTNTVSASDTITTGIGKLQGQLTDLSSHKVNGQALSNNQITLYGTSNAAANQAVKTVTLYDYSGDTPTPIQMDSIVPGTVIVVKPDYTHNNTGTVISGIRISNVSGDHGHAIKYDGGSIPTTQYEKLWNADHPSVFVYDGTNWTYVSGGKNAGVRTLEWGNNDTVHPAAINNYSTTFDNTTGNWYTTDSDKVVDGKFLAESLALKQNKIPAAFLEIANLDGTTSTPFSLRAVITSDDYATDVTNSALGILTANDVAELAATNVMGSLFNANEDYFDDHNISNRYSDLDKMVPTVAAVGEALHELQTSLGWTAMPWAASEIASAAAYDTTFVGDTGATANAWPAADKTKLVNGETFAKALATKQNQITSAEITFQARSNIPAVTLPAMTSYDSTNGLVANTYGILGWEDDLFGDDGDFGDLTDFSDAVIGNNASLIAKVEKLVPSVYAVANTIEERQQNLRAAFTSTTDYGEMKAKGGEAVIYGLTRGNPRYQYVTAGANQPLTAKSGADNVMLYLTGAKTLAQMQTSNFGAPSAFATDYQNRIKNAIVNLELIKDLYPNSWSSTQNTAVDGYSTTFDGTTGNWPTADKDKLVNGDRLAKGLALKQRILPTKTLTDDATNKLYPPTGGQTIGLTTTAGETEMRYITKGIGDKLTTFPNPNSSSINTVGDLLRSTRPDGREYISFASSNFGDGTSNYGIPRSKDALVSLELLRDVYKEVRNPTGTAGSAVIYSGVNSDGVPLYSELPVAHSITYQTENGETTIANGNDIASVELVGSMQDTITTGMVGVTLYADNTVTLPALASYEFTTNDGLVANTVGVLTAAKDNDYPLEWDALSGDEAGWQAGMDNVVPTLGLLGRHLKKLYWFPSDGNLPYTGAQLTSAINSYSTTFDSGSTHTDGNWPGASALGAYEGEVLVTVNTLAQSLALKQNKIPAAFLEIANLDGTTSTPFSLRAVITSDDYATDVTNSALGILTANDVAELAATNVMGSLFNANEDYFDDHNISNRYSDLDKMVPTVAAVGEALHELQTQLAPLSWDDSFRAAIGAYSTTFDSTSTHTDGNWPYQGENKLVNGTTLAQSLAVKQNKLNGPNGKLVTYTGTAGQLGSTTIATSITNTATTVPNTQAVYNAVNARQNKIPAAGKYRSSNTATTDTTISDWTATNIKGTALVTKTSSAGVVGERKIFEKSAIYTNDNATNIQIATIGAVMENTVTKTCVEYKPGTSGETAANCWLWTITGNAEQLHGCNATGTSCRSGTECCSGLCKNGACAGEQNLCVSVGAVCSILPCCAGLTCNSSNTCVETRI